MILLDGLNRTFMELKHLVDTSKAGNEYVLIAPLWN